MLQQNEPPDEQPSKRRPGYGKPKPSTLKVFIQRRLPPECTSETLLAAHERVLGMLWSQLVPLMGHSAVRAIFVQAIQAANRRHPLAGQTLALETSLDFSTLRLCASQVELAVLESALMTLACNIEKVTVGLVGAHLFLSLLGDIELELLRQDAGPLA